MSSYKQLTEEERYHIYTMRQQDISLRQIAKGMGRSHSSLSRELKRNKGKNGYRYKQAQKKASARHRVKHKAKKLTKDLKEYIREKLKDYWSPEQICGRLWLERKIRLSHETVYRFILKNKKRGGKLYRYLRHQSKPYRKRYGKKDYRSILCLLNLQN